MKIICAKRNEKDRTSCEAFVARSGLVRRFACDFQFFSDQDYMRFAQMILWRFALPKSLRRLRRLGLFHLSAFERTRSTLPNEKDPALRARPLLPDQDSNPNIQSQNLSYYHYTIRQFLHHHSTGKEDELSGAQDK